MSLRGWNKGKSPTMLCERKKEGEKTEKRGRGGVSISRPRFTAGKFNFDPVDSAVIPKFNL